MNTTRRYGLSTALGSVLLLAATGMLPAHAVIKCWTNFEGIRECGDKVPPEFAQRGHDVLTRHGVKTQAQDAAKTLEELEAERHAAEAERQAELAAAERRKADRVLLDTFSSEDDMVLARDGQIAHLESQIRLVESHIDKLRGNVDKLVAEAAEAERRGEKPPAALVRNIDSLQQQIAENEAFITAKRAEQDAIHNRFTADIARFRELKGQQSAE